jgi:site-specific DNA-methyltransferase (cytosine-N4-specific)
VILDHPATFYATDTTQLLLGDARTVLSTLPDGCVDVICTSPPYYAARDYGTGTWHGGRPDCDHADAPSRAQARRTGNARSCPKCGAAWQDLQYGLESTPQDYITTMRDVFNEARRVLHPQGTLWLNLGDSYASGEIGRNDAARRYPTLAAHQRDRADNQFPPTTGLRRKNLLGIPWRTALALQASGWFLRNAIVWAKTNPMPTSVTDRLSNTHETIFLFSRSPRYYFNLDAIRVPHRTPGLRSSARANTGHFDNTPATESTSPGAGNVAAGKYARAGRDVFNGRDYGPDVTAAGPHKAGHPNGKNPGDVWQLATANLRQAHFATYPLAIPLRAIAAGSRPGAVVCDPFSGAATTGLAALQLDRRYLGIDLNPHYHDIAQARLAEHTTRANQRHKENFQ